MSHEVKDLKANICTCSCGREFRLSVKSRELSLARRQDLLLDLHSAHRHQKSKG